MLRALAAALLLCACDEEDPSTSEHCVMVRMRLIEGDYWLEQLTANPEATAEQIAKVKAVRATLISQNWQCFK